MTPRGSTPELGKEAEEKATAQLDRILASGNVLVESEGAGSARVRSNQLDLLVADRQNTLRTATFSGNVRMENSGAHIHALVAICYLFSTIFQKKAGFPSGRPAGIGPRDDKNYFPVASFLGFLASSS